MYIRRMVELIENKDNLLASLRSAKWSEKINFWNGLSATEKNKLIYNLLWDEGVICKPQDGLQEKNDIITNFIKHLSELSSIDLKEMDNPEQLIDNGFVIHIRELYFDAMDALKKISSGESAFPGALVHELVAELWRYPPSDGMESVNNTLLTDGFLELDDAMKIALTGDAINNYPKFISGQNYRTEAEKILEDKTYYPLVAAHVVNQKLILAVSRTQDELVKNIFDEICNYNGQIFQRDNISKLWNNFNANDKIEILNHAFREGLNVYSDLKGGGVEKFLARVRSGEIESTPEIFKAYVNKIVIDHYINSGKDIGIADLLINFSQHGSVIGISDTRMQDVKARF